MTEIKKVEIKTSDDGSHTLYVSHLDEHYHSVNGAINESMHVFIHAGLNQVIRNRVRVLEFGFGTGLNALLSAVNAHDKQIHYHTLEKYPVEIDVIDKLNYSDLCDQNFSSVFKQLHLAPWGLEQEIKQNFYLTKQLCDFKEVVLDQEYDLVFFDAFAPDVQPDLWTKEIFAKIYDALSPGGIITTYCAKGVVRRTMQEVGFKMERLPGPPGKREMLRGIKPL